MSADVRPTVVRLYQTMTDAELRALQVGLSLVRQSASLEVAHDPTNAPAATVVTYCDERLGWSTATLVDRDR